MSINQSTELLMLQYRGEFLKGVADGVLVDWTLADYIASRKTDLQVEQKQKELDDIYSNATHQHPER